MTTPEELQEAFIALRSIRELGIKLTISESGNINCRWSERLPDSISELLARHKSGVLKILRAEGIAGEPLLRVEIRAERGRNKRAVFVFTNDSRPLWV